VLAVHEFLDLLARSIRSTGLVSRLEVWIPVTGALRDAARRALPALDF
jgi:hypothetical protein